MPFRRPSPAMLVALLALFVALGGSSYAALNLPKGSVGAKQLKQNSVTSPKVKRGSLLVSDFRASQRARLRGPRGRRGPQGLQGLQGPQGVPGPAGTPNGYTQAQADALFLSARGATRLTVPPGAWKSIDLFITEEFLSNVAFFSGEDVSGNGFVSLDPAVPAVLAGRRVAVAAATLCYDATSPDGSLEAVELDVFRADPLGAVPVGQAVDDTTRNDAACRRYALPEPVALGDQDFVNFRFQMAWSDEGGGVAIRGAWIELVPAA